MKLLEDSQSIIRGNELCMKNATCMDNEECWFGWLDGFHEEAEGADVGYIQNGSFKDNLEKENVFYFFLGNVLTLSTIAIMKIRQAIVRKIKNVIHPMMG